MKTETLTDAELRTHFLGEPTRYPQDKAKQTAELIVTAVNACKEINPDNPLAVANAIFEMWSTLKGISNYDGFIGLNKNDAETFASIAKKIINQIEP